MVLSNNSCNKRSTICSSRMDSLFRLSLADTWTIVFMRCEDKQNTKIQRIYELNRKIMGSVYNELRELASNYFDLDPIRLGGLEIICQIDERFYCHKQKLEKEEHLIEKAGSLGFLILAQNLQNFIWNLLLID
ncbi:hypothetical protein H311_00489 [Anncaliia algerae PRA109]|nr:hypothetical protein H311_00489 [Anncaliia algerae PRA109]